MTEEDALSWLAALPAAVRTALLADPDGDLQPDLIHRMPSLVVKTYWAGNPDAGRCELWPQYAASLRKGRRVFDAWWNGLSEDNQAALVEHRGGPVPNEYRAAVDDLRPLGVAVFDGATSTGPFQLHPLVVDYLNLQADV